MANARFSFEFLDLCCEDLAKSLQMGPIITDQGIRYLTEDFIDQIDGLKVFIYANEHPPPHFHVKYCGEENSFSLSDGTPLYPDNGLKKYFRNISKWYSNNRESLILAWNRNRPSDCPVGPIA